MPYGDEKSYSFFKMKGSPMKRNFGIGDSPMRDEDEPIEGGTLPEVKVVAKDTRRDILAKQAFKGFSGTEPTWGQASQSTRSRAYKAADEYIAREERKKNVPK